MLTVALVHGREKTPLPGAVSLQKSVGSPISAKKMSGKRGVKPQPPQPHCDVMEVTSESVSLGVTNKSV